MSSKDPNRSYPDQRRIFRRNDALVSRRIAGEYFLVPVRFANAQQLFVLNPVGAFIWQELDGTRDVETVRQHLLENFEISGEEARDDLVEYLTVLRDAELIVEVGDDPAPASPAPASSAPASPAPT